MSILLLFFLNAVDSNRACDINHVRNMEEGKRDV